MFTARQPGFFSFTYDFFDTQNQHTGSIVWPDVAVATNSRLKDIYPKSLNSRIEIHCRNVSYQIEFEYLNRGWRNDIRFSLKQEQSVLAVADILHQESALTRATINLTQPFSGAVIKRKSILTAHYEIQQDGQKIGAIYEKPGFTLKRRIYIDLPDSIDAVVQFFLFFLVCNDAYS